LLLLLLLRDLLHAQHLGLLLLLLELLLWLLQLLLLWLLQQDGPGWCLHVGPHCCL
jgi:hypothetical protein